MTKNSESDIKKLEQMQEAYSVTNPKGETIKLKRRGNGICRLMLISLLLCLPAVCRGEALEARFLQRGAPGYALYRSQCAFAEAETPIALYGSEGVFLSEGEEVTFTFSVTEDVFGYPVFRYAMTDDSILDNLYSLRLDGVYPYTEAQGLTLDSLWTLEGDFALDRYGNEVVSMPVKSYAAQDCRMTDRAGLYSGGMGLALTAGEHSMTIICREGAFRLLGVTLERAVKPAQRQHGEMTGSRVIALQAEKVLLRNNPNIRPAADYDIALSPYSSSHKVINYIEDISYKYPLDRLTYRFTVEEAGYYGLALRMRQSELANFPVFRTILLDGEIPGEDFDTVAFRNCLSFENQIVRNADGETATLYLTAGEHELTLFTSLDPLRPALQLLGAVSDEMAQLTLAITKVTGGNTDFFRDFNLTDFDFHIADDLARWTEELTMAYDALRDVAQSDARVGALSNLQLAIQTLEQLALKPDDLPKKLGQFSQGSASARAAIVSTVEQLGTSPMGLDAIYLFTDERLLPQDKGLLAKAEALGQRFAASFGEQDYMVGEENKEGRLQVWVNRPRQYLEIMQRMADTSFTPKTGVAVDFSIMPDESKLVLANVSGGAPDVALGVSSGRVYDLAVRGALKNLREYADFRTVGKWFPTGLLIPGVCDEGVYALPETFNFNVLFYRSDILESVGLKVPDSYEEVLAMLPALHRFGLNYNSFVANAVGYKSFAITTPFIFQCGGKLYESGNIKTLLDQPEAIAGLQLLTDSFIIYDMDYEVASFYQAFRDGTLPIGTSNYATYNLLMNAAPELADRWNIALYPGVTDENGVVQRWTSGAEQSDFIFQSSQMQEEAWQFLTWWMSEDTQTEFAYTLQSTLGNEYLWNSANTAAFERSPWPTAHKKVLSEQMQWIYEAPRVPGSYMVERELSNAVNAVALEGQNLRAALDEAIKRINREVERKLEEFGRIKNGALTAPFTVADIETVRGWLE